MHHIGTNILYTTILYIITYGNYIYFILSIKLATNY
jgi:hypothetical protein